MQPGELLGDRYRLVAPLGHGGTAVVWQAHDQVLGREVAVKLLAARTADDAALVRRLRAEAQAAARLHHPHVVTVYDFGQAARSDGPPVPYVVLELVAGRPLSEVLRQGPLPWREAVRICAEVAAALAAAHARGIVHRDVKPENVMLTDSGAKLVDFGISATIGEVDTGPDGELLCTPAYLAPERLRTGPVRAACDMYGLGLILYRALTGEFPWRWERTAELLAAHRHVAPAPLRPVRGMPVEVAALCLSCLAKAPGDRPSSVEAARKLAAAVRPAATAPDGSPPEMPAPASPQTRPTAGQTETGEDTEDRAGYRTSRLPLRRRVLAVTAAVAVFAVTGFGFPRIAGDDPTAGSGATGAAPTVPCQVRYEVREDSGGEFVADLTLDNLGSTPVTDWRLEFTFPADQEIVRSTPGGWRQEGRTVSLEGAGPAATLPVGPPVALELAGSYRWANPLPTGFRLNHTECTRVMTAAAGPPDHAGP